MRINKPRNLLTILSVLAVWLYSFTSMADDGGNKWIVGNQEVTKGTTVIIVPIYIYNAVSITGIQFDLYLSDGIEVQTTGRTKTLAIDKGDDRFDELDHSLSSVVQSDGSIRVLCASQQNTSIWDDDIEEKDIRLSAPVFNITLIIPEEIGAYNIECKNIVLSHYESGKTQKYNLDDCVSYVAVKPASGNEMKISDNMLSIASAGTIDKDTYSLILESQDNIASVDLRAAKLGDDIKTVDDLKCDGTNENTLFILPSGSSVTGKNVIIDNKCNELELSDGELFGSDQSFKANKVTYKRTFSNHAWQAFYLPFDVTFNTLSENFDIAKFSDTQATENDIAVENVNDGSLTANTPYLIKLKDSKSFGDYDIPGNSSVSRSIENGLQIGGYYILRTTYKPMNGKELEGKFALHNGVFKQAGDNASLKAFRIYLEKVSDEGSNAKEINLFFDGTATCTSKINIRNIHSNYYNLQGMKLVNPQYGMNIINGKVVFINK